MTLYELSDSYRTEAMLLRFRIAALRDEEIRCGDAEAARTLRFRIAALEPILREMRELSQLTAHYYDRGYFRSGKYTVR